MSLLTKPVRNSAATDSDALPELCVTITKKMIIMGATSSRDWQPIHHDSEYAREEAGLPDVIMNNYTQSGWLSRYVTDWSGPQARLARLKFSMRSPLCPGDEAVFTGIVQTRDQRADFLWLDIIVSVLVREKLSTTAAIRLALPFENGAASPWQCADKDWQP